MWSVTLFFSSIGRQERARQDQHGAAVFAGAGIDGGLDGRAIEQLAVALGGEIADVVNPCTPIAPQRFNEGLQLRLQLWLGRRGPDCRCRRDRP